MTATSSFASQVSPIQIAEKLAQLIQCRTVSHPDRDEEDRAEFTRHVELLNQLFPAIADVVEQHTVGITGQLWHWKGQSDAKPLVLMAHQDVVPVESEADWEFAPFEGIIANGWIHGRGVLDDKGDLTCILQAAEELAQIDFTPRQDVYFFFGDCEEIAGPTATEAVEFLRNRGITPWMVIDEGGAIAHEAFPGVKIPVGVIGVSEKGIMDLLLEAQDSGGHASAPPNFGAVQRIARAITRLQRKPFPAIIHPVTEAMFKRLGENTPGVTGTVLKTIARPGRLPGELLARVGAEPAAMVRTTVAATELEGSDGTNVLARRAAVTLNIRISVTESVASTVEGIRKRISDPQIKHTVLTASEPSPISPVDSDQFALIESCMKDSHPEALPVPYLMMAATDSRFFTGISEHVYRFAPLAMDKQQRGAIHGTNESVAIEELAKGVQFYSKLLKAL
ncbi:acetylornithine deacetylase [Arthrobacter sp. MYb227]|uniref:M20/M25/M40 family metallo-hydrolase n=1 Tax=Arthrobacter sp. MYb227 TaxID=1848601 RepID=UPI000CFD2FB4|nr:M20/M25/M40 family metallo-hydrolase [Arthrobacter sp. MYb227]PQZ92176.1 acetylornithine deacetylase [Arthrobacter sp. MYb227]